MIDLLADICDNGSPLIGVTCTLFSGDPRFITAAGLQFESIAVTCRANPDDDTLSMSLGSLTAEPDEKLIVVGNTLPWSNCLGLSVNWGWELTNQQGYVDGVRIEFQCGGVLPTFVVELIVAASAIKVFVAVNAGLAEHSEISG
jgi:hypothetical protein